MMRSATPSSLRPSRSSSRHPALLRVSGPLLNLLTMSLGLAAGYFLTIQSIRLELAAKAETAVVETLDRKLAGFEVLVREGLVSRDQFFQFSRDTELRLVRIEQHLINQSGVNRARP